MILKEPEGDSLGLLSFAQQPRQRLHRFRQGQKAGRDAQLRAQRYLAVQGVGIVEQYEVGHAALFVGEVAGAQLRREEYGAAAAWW